MNAFKATLDVDSRYLFCLGKVCEVGAESMEMLPSPWASAQRVCGLVIGYCHMSQDAAHRTIGCVRAFA